VPTPRVRDLVRDGHLDVIRDAMAEGGAEGMQTFDMALYDLIKAGRLTLPEAVPFAESANDLKLRFSLQQATEGAAEQIKLV
jgi:twitching motility protein PilU